MPGSPCPALKTETPAADFTVSPPAGEFAEIRMDAAEMRRAAEQTGGRFYTFETADRAAGRFAARPPGAHRIAAAAAAVEHVARAGAVPWSADRRMDTTETAGNGIE